MINKKNMSQQIIEIIIGEIEAKRLKPGDKLQNERELAAHLGVSRVPLREALRTLSNMGLLVTKHGEGTFVSQYNPERMGTSFQMYALLDETPIQEMLQVRKIMEPEAARLAAKLATREDIDNIRKYKEIREQKHFQNQSGDRHADQYHDADTLFHRAIAEATHNTVFVNFLDVICRTMNLHQKKASSHPGMFESTTVHHNRIYQAILDHDPDEAANAMLKHIEEVERAVKEASCFSSDEGSEVSNN